MNRFLFFKILRTIFNVYVIAVTLTVGLPPPTADKGDNRPKSVVGGKSPSDDKI